MMLPRRKPYAGFTLVELMVVVAIIAILAAIAIPSYVDYVTRSKLSEAYNTLSAYRVSMEQYYQDNRTYIGTAAPSMSPCGAVTPTGLKYFKITCLAATASTYTAQVQGTTGSPTDGFTFAITNANVQQTTAVPTAKGWSLPSTNCWVVRKSGSCQ